MSIGLTLALIAACTALAVLAGWRGARPPDLMRGPRLIPWRFIMLLAVALTSLLVVHLAHAALGGPPPPTY